MQQIKNIMNMALNKVVVASMALLLADEEEEKIKSKPRTMWIRPWMQRRRTDGAFNTIFKELKEEDADGFKGYIRMNLTQFSYCYGGECFVLMCQHK